MIKTCVIVTYSFPPDNRVSALRPYKMATAFANRGWQVYVLTCATNGAQKGGEKDLSGINVVKFDSPALSRFLAGNFEELTLSSKLSDLSRKLIRRCLVPDHTFLIKNSVKIALKNLLNEINPQCVVSISYPFSMHAAVNDIKCIRTIPVWVADNRDMWSGNPYRGLHLLPGFLERRLEKTLLRQADLVTFASEETRIIYMERYQLRKTETVFNGFEGGVEFRKNNSINVRGSIKFVHTGSLYSGKRDIFPLITSSAKIARSLDVKCEIILYGKGCSNVLNDLNMEALKNNNVEVKVMGNVPRDEAYAAQLDSDFLVVVMSNNNFDKTYVPAKIFEYARTGKPVIALCDEKSELSNIVNKYELGVATFVESKISDYVIEFCNNLGGLDLSGRRSKILELSDDYQFGSLVKSVEQNLELNIAIG